MAAGRSAPEPAFVLHQWDWSETSLILDLLTRERGRLAVVAKGAKRPYSQLRPVLMPFQRLLVLTSRPKGGAGDGGEAGADILTLRSAEYAGAGAALPPARLMSGFYLNELLLRGLARGDPHERLFDAYADTLRALADPAADPGDADVAATAADPADETPLRAFELLLLRELGLLPDLARCTTTQARVQPEAGYRLLPEAGLLPDGSDTALSGQRCLALQAALDRTDAGAAAALRRACAPVRPALKAQLRAVLHYHLGSPPLRTRQLVLDLRRLAEQAAPRPLHPSAPTPGAPPNPPPP